MAKLIRPLPVLVASRVPTVMESPVLSAASPLMSPSAVMLARRAEAALPETSTLPPAAINVSVPSVPALPSAVSPAPYSTMLPDVAPAVSATVPALARISVVTVPVMLPLPVVPAVTETSVVACSVPRMATSCPALTSAWPVARRSALLLMLPPAVTLRAWPALRMLPLVAKLVP